MPRHDGSTRRLVRRKNIGHRMHKRTRVARRLKTRRTTGTGTPAWGRGGLS